MSAMVVIKVVIIMINKIGNIDFDTFSETIDCLRIIYDWQLKAEELGINMIDVDEISSLESQTLEVLKAGMGLRPDNDDIAYYCYERNFGRDDRLGDVLLGDKLFPLNNNKSLWELIALRQALIRD